MCIYGVRTPYASFVDGYISIKTIRTVYRLSTRLNGIKNSGRITENKNSVPRHK